MNKVFVVVQRYKKIFASIVAIFLISLIALSITPYKSLDTDSGNRFSSTQEKEKNENQFLRAKVLKSVKTSDDGGIVNYDVTAELLDSVNKGVDVTFEFSTSQQYAPTTPLKKDEMVIVGVNSDDTNTYYFTDRYRLPSVLIIFALFIVVLIFIGGRRGASSLGGLSLSIMVLAFYVIPSVAAGKDTLLTCVIGVMIMTTALFVAHGINRRGFIAFVATIVTLFIAIGLASVAVSLTQLGITYISEESQTAFRYAQSMRGLILGSLIITLLGVLDDITIGQVSIVDEVYKTNPKQSLASLYSRGMSVGREHVAALVNTLALVYAGTALPMLVGVATYQDLSFILFINNESVTEEIVRTLVASTTLLLAVPISTLFAAYLVPRWQYLQKYTWLPKTFLK